MLSVPGEEQEPVDPAVLVKGCGAAIIAVDNSGAITAWNPAAERLYGYSSNVMLGQSILMLSPRNRPADLAESLDAARAGATLISREAVHIRQNGRLVEVFLSVSPVFKTGTVAGAVLVAQDMTERRREEDERLELITELSRALSKMGAAP